MSADDRERSAVIPTNPRTIERLWQLDRCLTAICPQVHKVFLAQRGCKVLPVLRAPMVLLVSKARKVSPVQQVPMACLVL